MISLVIGACFDCSNGGTVAFSDNFYSSINVMVDTPLLRDTYFVNYF